MRTLAIVAVMVSVAEAKTAIEVRDADGTAAGATVTIDGEPHGKVPADVPVVSGKHLVQIDKGDYHRGAWVTVRLGDTQAVSLGLGDRWRNTTADGAVANLDRGRKLLAVADYVGCGDAFLAFAQLSPRQDSSRWEALFLAGTCYRRADRPTAALAAFDALAIDSDVLHDTWLLAAMQATAEVQLATLDTSGAIDTWLALHAFASNSKKLHLDAQPDTANAAIASAARAAQLGGDDARAAELYTQYLAGPTEPRLADRALWALAAIYGRLGDSKKRDDALATWRKTYGTKPDNADDYIRSFADGGGRASDDATVTAWQAVGSPAKTAGARIAAAAMLRSLEDDYATKWVPLAILVPATSVRDAKSQNATLVKARDDLQAAYQRLDAFGLTEYSIVAIVRFGDLEDGFATKLQQVPIPTPVANACTNSPAVCQKYQTTIAQGTANYRAASEKSWADALRANVPSAWTELAATELDDQYPGKYPAPKHWPLVDTTDAP